ncbi:hypothetical protein TRFO_36608 [Tritrichomonas foetus]|uniref:Protein kinase domain-containing protein n=1 Tax=Tritrichomonas foetus TaxID=1144522 RepID=A0A1J4JDG0_9EUKA|nr:hypothetical protein TRFO_36608 [Tritrichomonas foetus]|eukprot:OHS97194.1 hypothetical protein TRFO_36608 [Tritrichomonas foetus]
MFYDSPINLARDFSVKGERINNIMKLDTNYQLTAFQNHHWEIIYFSKMNQKLIDILKSQEMEPFVSLSIQTVHKESFLSICCQSKLFLIRIETHCEYYDEKKIENKIQEDSLNDLKSDSLNKYKESLKEIICLLNGKLIYCLPEDQEILETIISQINNHNHNQNTDFNSNNLNTDPNNHHNFIINFANQDTSENILHEINQLIIRCKEIRSRLFYHLSISFLEFLFITKNSFFIYLFHRNEFNRTLFRNNDFYYPEKYLKQKFSSFNEKTMVVIRLLGKGSKGICKLVLHLETGLLFATKTHHKRQDFEKERDFYQTIEPHPFILRCYGYIYPDILILDWKVNGNLKNFIFNKNPYKIVDDNVKNKIIIEILFALDYLHSHGYMHRDMKTDNILIDDEYKSTICDCDLVREFEINTPDKPYSGDVGTYLYSAPEVLKNQNYSFQIDIYSLGCIIIEIVTEKQLFAKDKVPQLSKEKYGMCEKLFKHCTKYNALERTLMIYLRYKFLSGRFTLKNADSKQMIKYLYQLEGDLSRYKIPTEKRADFQLLKKLSEKGNCQALYYIGIIYYFGEGLTQSYTIAKEHFEKAIQVSPTFPNPYVFLGLIYKNGYGVEKNLTKSSELYKKASDLNFPWGTYNYAYNVFHGLRTKSKPLKAIKMFEETSKTIPYANYALGMIKYLGLKGIPVDKVTAIKHLQDGVDNKSTLAMEFIAQIYFVGEEGILEKNRKEAVKLLETVNLYHDLRLYTYFLAYMYDVGDGTKQNQEKATKIFEKAPKKFEDIQNDNSIAHIETFYFFFGYMKMYGRGVQKNEEEAIEYFQKANVSFLPEAQKELDKYYQTHSHNQKSNVKNLNF